MSEESKRVEVDLYGWGNHTPWLETQLYCPNCGRQEVVRQDDFGDYYQGEEHACLACCLTFQDANQGFDVTDEKRVKALRAAFGRPEPDDGQGRAVGDEPKILSLEEIERIESGCFQYLGFNVEVEDLRHLIATARAYHVEPEDASALEHYRGLAQEYRARLERAEAERDQAKAYNEHLSRGNRKAEGEIVRLRAENERLGKALSAADVLLDAVDSALGDGFDPKTVNNLFDQAARYRTARDNHGSLLDGLLHRELDAEERAAGATPDTDTEDGHGR